MTILDGDLKITFNLQYGKVLSIAFRSPFFISNDYLSRVGKRNLIPILTQNKYGAV